MECDQPPARVALEGEDRMRDKSDLQAAFGQLAQHRIDQKRHVIVDDFQYRKLFEPCPGQARLLEPDFGRAGHSTGEERPGGLGEGGDLASVVAHEILRHRTREQSFDKLFGYFALAGAEERLGHRHEQRRHALILSARKLLVGHA